ncbi:MAG: Shedu anti-phage system protein SduA domain-containing protein [bacterium]
MKIINETRYGIKYLFATLKEKSKTITRVVFWKIPHKTDKEDIRLKIAKYKKEGFLPNTVLENIDPKSDLTLDNEEFKELLTFISDNYVPFKEGIKKYIPIDKKFNNQTVDDLRNIFNNYNKQKILNIITKNNIFSDDLIFGLQHKKRVDSVTNFEDMLDMDLPESKWQHWFKENEWVLGSEFVKIIDERKVDTQNITDYLMQAYDGFLDIIEIKSPRKDLNFWADKKDHDNYIPSVDLIKAIIQATKYIYEVEREANNIKFFERLGNIKTIKPRCVLIFGRSADWNDQQKEDYRILNSGYHNLTIMTYDHVLGRAKRIIK